MREYLCVTPTSERLEPEGIPRILESLHKLTTTGSTGLPQKLNPLHTETPPRSEFLALSEGEDDPVEFGYTTAGEQDSVHTDAKSLLKDLRPLFRPEGDLANLARQTEFDLDSKVIY